MQRRRWDDPDHFLGGTMVMVLRSDLYPLPAASEDPLWKQAHFANALLTLTEHHQRNCEPYRNILQAMGFRAVRGVAPEDLPFLPCNLFRNRRIISVPESDIRRTLVSSGTTGRPLSQIHLDATTAARQMLALSLIVSGFTKHERLPLMLLDSPAVLAGGDAAYAGRAAGVQGFSMLGKNRTFALDAEMNLDRRAIRGFLEKHGDTPFLLYGFTYAIWTQFYDAIERSGEAFDLSQGILVHGGGWKRLSEREVSDAVFRKRSESLVGLSRVHNYYGMVEQAGSIYLQCKESHFHSSNFSELFIRNSRTFGLAEPGERGIIQTLSLVPYSYPGHSLLTEDEGILVGVDDCACGRPGRYFTICGRLKDVELKGCGDTGLVRHV